MLSTARAAAAPVLHHYRNAFSGFAARLTPAEAAGLARAPAVVAVTPDTVSHPLADAAAVPATIRPRRRRAAGPGGTAFLGLPDGLWERLGGPGKAGEGVKIGVIDTGIYPEHPSFADTPDRPRRPQRYDGPAYAPPPTGRAPARPGRDFTAAACNNKLIGARYFVDGFGAENLKAGEFLSPRDANGHGSHVAATAAGNYGVEPKIGGHDLGIPAVSGIAPRARIAAYKVCWTGDRPPAATSVEGSCMGSDTVAAIDAAVADGVDVINYSVGIGHLRRVRAGRAGVPRRRRRRRVRGQRRRQRRAEARHGRIADRRAVGHVGGGHHAAPHVRVDLLRHARRRAVRRAAPAGAPDGGCRRRRRPRSPLR